MKRALVLAGIIVMLTSTLFAEGTAPVTKENIMIESTITSKSKATSKPETNANPLISNIFCADPTAIEFNGRLYVYGTNDHAQYEAVGANGKNTYEFIKSLVMLSTDDMVNWTYHGLIKVDEIAPWIVDSWAPSIISRVERNGQTHFYLYFSNSGCGVGVLTATNPLGPWSDPLGHSLVTGTTPGLGLCSAPFDPGVCIDDNGVGWLAFGGGNHNPKGTDFQPGNARIVQLGEDMISLASDIIPIKAPYHFEANELNFINGTYVYTYNTNWMPRDKWELDGKDKPSTCSMVYMTSKTPLDAASWEYQSHYFRNPGEFSMEYSNNHTHLHQYKNKYYLFYHAMYPEKALGTEGGFRSLCVDEVTVDETNVSITRKDGTKKGVSQIKKVNPYKVNQAATLFTSADITYNETEREGFMTVSGTKSGAWTYVKGVNFKDGASSFSVKAKGNGRIEVYFDSLKNKPVAAVDVATDTFTDVPGEINSSAIQPKDSSAKSNMHAVYFVLSGANVQFDSWKFGN